MCTKVSDKEFSEKIALLVQDLSVRKVTQELNNESECCDTNQGDEVGSSTTRELTRSKENDIVSTFPQGLETMENLWSIVEYF